MWILAMFDLPTETKEERRRYREFRKCLLKQGFAQLQYSVYARFVGDESRSLKFKRVIKEAIPEEGEVRILTVTDFQYGKMDVFSSRKKVKAEEIPEEIMLF